MILTVRWTCDAGLTALFTPARPGIGRYDVCTTADAIREAIADSGAEGLHFAPVQILGPLDAFGAAGPYNRAALARLYVGRRLSVARGWADRGGRFESVTLLSPYPDAALTRLNAGTMAIRLSVRRDPS